MLNFQPALTTKLSPRRFTLLLINDLLADLLAPLSRAATVPDTSSLGYVSTRPRAGITTSSAAQQSGCFGPSRIRHPARGGPPEHAQAPRTAPLLHCPNRGTTLTPDSTHKRAYVGGAGHRSGHSSNPYLGKNILDSSERGTIMSSQQALRNETFGDMMVLDYRLVLRYIFFHADLPRIDGDFP